MKRLGITVGVSFVLMALMVVITLASSTRRVSVEDRCDPDTFNAAIGPGTCVGDGNVTFAEFLEKLNPVDFGHDKWRFKFGRGKVDADETLQAVNRGGEFHTFTEVAEFGGGCVPFLNAALGLTPVPECANQQKVFADTGLPPGATLDVAKLPKGTHKFQCLIHPWMRVEVEARGK